MKDNRALVNEIFILRSAACLSILLLHVLDRVYLDNSETINSFSVLLTFGTPAFVFISEFIISYSYRNRAIGSFWGNRIKYIFLPYLFFGVFYAAAKAVQETGTSAAFPEAFFTYTWRHILLGDYHGYFILIIFQFYALHLLFHNYLKKASPKKVIAGSFLINAAYLSFFNFVPPMDVPFADYIWTQYYWVPFLGWSFYFTVAFYSGYYYEAFQRLLVKYRHWTTVSVLLFGLLSISLYQLGVTPVASSKRIDMVFFTVSMIFFLYSHAMLLKRVPRFFTWVSQYSFGIYLFHPFFLAVFTAVSFAWQDLPPLLSVPVLFFSCTGLCALTIYLFNKLPFGAYIVGKVGISQKRTAQDPLKEIQAPSVKVN
ncbi:acyltransferase family protein [Domibacillus sp. A3M-37]|uniref:acyltransferase family protein n=1 Tax=Domibacillus sp. A3M-37 TaxID=2962037 RepID=UPI0020B73892|nr:acyltransferase family protein [Domibacillus sp. A3M-37]MCP3761322.1 acyltransferase family protein [Domibacillus sp. A3M-37]